MNTAIEYSQCHWKKVSEPSHESKNWSQDTWITINWTRFQPGVELLWLITKKQFLMWTMPPKNTFQKISGQENLNCITLEGVTKSYQRLSTNGDDVILWLFSLEVAA